MQHLDRFTFIGANLIHLDEVQKQFEHCWHNVKFGTEWFTKQVHKGTVQSFGKRTLLVIF